jgi:hypothetical protein
MAPLPAAFTDEVMMQHCWLGETPFDYPFSESDLPKAIAIQINGNDQCVPQTSLSFEAAAMSCGAWLSPPYCAQRPSHLQRNHIAAPFVSWLTHMLARSPRPRNRPPARPRARAPAPLQTVLPARSPASSAT